VHFRASPPMAGDNHRVPHVDLTLLPSTPDIAPVGPRCGDCGRTETPQWMAGPMGPARSMLTAALVAGMLGGGGRGVLSTSIKPRFPSHRCHQKLACSGSSAREAGLVARGSCGPTLRH
jgi:hypothetical protein